MSMQSLTCDGLDSPQPQRTVASRSRPQTRKPCVISYNAPEWALETTTCLGLGQDPSGLDHKFALCNICVKYWQKKLKCDIRNSSEEPTAGLPISYTWELRDNFCCRGSILISRPVFESPAQTTCVNELDFFVKSKNEIFVSYTKRR